MILAWLAGAFIFGIFAGSKVVLSSSALFVATGSCAVPLVLIWRRRRIRIPILMVVFLLLGMGRAETSRFQLDPDQAAFYNGSYVTMTGFVNTEPDVRDRGNNYVVQVQSLTLGSRTLKVQGQVEVHTSPGQLFDAGDQLQLSGLLKTPIDSPQIPYREILANRGIYSEMSFPRGFVTGHVSLGLLGLAMNIRSYIETTIGGSLPEPDATFLIAILIGARSAQLGTLAPILIATGLIHLIAISGLKIAIVAGTVNSFLRRVTSRSPTLVLSSTALLAYWLVSGATVAGLRASIMWLLVFVAAYLGRPTFALVSLGIAASGMLAFDPALLWDTGFEFTTLATAAIVLLGPMSERVTRRIPSVFAASMTTTLSAQIGVLPLQVISFHLLSPISVLANTVVLPIIPLTMVVGFLTVLYPHGPLLAISYAMVHSIILIAQWIDATPFSSISLSQLPGSLTMGYYAALLLLAIAASRLVPRSRRRIHGEWLLGSAVAVVSLTAVLAAPVKTTNQIAFVSKGAALISFNRTTILLDGGASPSLLLVGLGRQLPFPRNYIDAIISTDPRADNVASLLQVVDHYHVGHVLDTGVEYPSHTYASWRTALMNRHLQPEALRPGASVRGGRPHTPSGLS